MFKRFQRYLALLSAVDAVLSMLAFFLSGVLRWVLPWGRQLPAYETVNPPAVYIIIALV